jgi:hypothetical protein
MERALDREIGDAVFHEMGYPGLEGEGYRLEFRNLKMKPLR